MSGAAQGQNPSGGFDFVQIDPAKNVKTIDANGAASSASLATIAANSVPAASADGIVRATQDATTATGLASNACLRGFWLLNHPQSGGVIYFAKAGATAPSSDGTNSIGYVVPGDRVWLGYANTNAVQIIASATTTYYSVVTE